MQSVTPSALESGLAKLREFTTRKPVKLGDLLLDISHNEAAALLARLEAADRRSVTLSCAMLREALEFIAPDDAPDQLSADVTIEWSDAGHSGAGYYCYDAEYPDEGSLLLGAPRPAGGGE